MAPSLGESRGQKCREAHLLMRGVFSTVCHSSFTFTSPAPRETEVGGGPGGGGSCSSKRGRSAALPRWAECGRLSSRGRAAPNGPFGAWLVGSGMPPPGAAGTPCPALLPVLREAPAAGDDACVAPRGSSLSRGRTSGDVAAGDPSFSLGGNLSKPKPRVLPRLHPPPGDAMCWCPWSPGCAA